MKPSRDEAERADYFQKQRSHFWLHCCRLAVLESRSGECWIEDFEQALLSNLREGHEEDETHLVESYLQGLQELWDREICRHHDELMEWYLREMETPSKAKTKGVGVQRGKEIWTAFF